MQRIKVTNHRATFVTLWLEPWGEDYGMLPGDEFDVVAADAGDDFYFHLTSEDRDMKLYAEGDVREVTVYNGGAELSCGHNRQE